MKKQVLDLKRHDTFMHEHVEYLLVRTHGAKQPADKNAIPLAAVDHLGDVNDVEGAIVIAGTVVVEHTGDLLSRHRVIN